MKIADKLRALRIKADLIADEEVGLMEINPEVRDGLAILTGEVENEHQRRTAEEIAYQTEGIMEVRNELKVVPMTHSLFAAGGLEDEFLGPRVQTSEQFIGRFTDAEIDEEIHDRLAAETRIDTSRIEYATNGQIVRLSGSVSTQEELNRLLDIVINVSGVLGIDSDVRVERGEVGTPVSES